MCKHVMLVSMTQGVDSAVQKSCKPAMLGRIWHASKRALNLEHSPPHHFACSQWQTGYRPSTLYILYRWLFFIAIVTIAISSFVCQKLPKNYQGPKIELNYYKWFIYFTNWGLIQIAIEAGLALCVLHRFRAEKPYNIPCEEDDIPMPLSRRTRTPLICRAYWLAHNIATDLAFVITLVYWVKVHDPKIHEINALNLLVHGGNSIFMLFELVVTAHPIRAAHALYSASAGLSYGLFSALYWALGGTDRVGKQAIYQPLDWSKPGSAFGFVALCAAVMVCAHLFATCIVAARMRLATRLRMARAQSDRLTLPTH